MEGVGPCCGVGLTWTSKVPNILAQIPFYFGINAIILGTVEVRVDGGAGCRILDFEAFGIKMVGAVFPLGKSAC